MIPVLLALGLAGFVMFKAFHRGETVPAKPVDPNAGKRYHVRFIGDHVDSEYFATDILKEAEAAYDQLRTKFTEQGFHGETIYIIDVGLAAEVPITIKEEVIP